MISRGKLALQAIAMLGITLLALLAFKGWSNSGNRGNNAPVESVPNAGQKEPRSKPERAPADSPTVIATEEEARKVAKAVTRDTYKERWALISKSDSSDDDRIIEYLGLASSMALAGHAKETIPLIFETFGPGRFRQELLAAVFRRAWEPAEANELFKLLQFPDERSAACEGLSRALSVGKQPIPSNIGEYHLPKDSLNELLEKLAQKHVSQRSSSSPQELSASFKEALELPLSQEGQNRVLRNLQQVAPFDCWNYLEETQPSNSKALRQELISYMIGKNASKSIELIVASQSPTSTGLLTPAMLHWMNKDSDQPVKWVQEHREQLTPLQQSSAYRGIVEFALQNGEIETARSWANLIPNPEVKSDAMTAIEKHGK